jgi:hypothetical protein
MLDIHGFAGSNAKDVKQALAKPMKPLGADIVGMDGFGRVVGSICVSKRILGSNGLFF